MPPADIIIADVSGIPEIFGRTMEWYPQGIPTGGSKGSEITCELLRRAPRYMKENSRLYFPTADDLLDADEILDVAHENFGKVENALCSDYELGKWKEEASKTNGKLWQSPEYLWFLLRGEDINKLVAAYGGKIPDSIHIQEVKGRKFWRGRIHVASEPKI